MREIPLSRGMVSIVDDEDYETVVAAGPWYACPSRNTFYAHRNTPRPGGGRTTQQMHTLLTGWPLADHANGNGLDNRRENLRPATSSQNAMNRATPSDNTSGFKGISRSGLKWRAYVGVSGRQTYLGSFTTPEEAARAYDAAALHHYGEFARPNFPQEVSA